MQQRAELDAQIPGGHSFARFAGKWTVNYSAGQVREYTLDATGRLEFPVESRGTRLLEKDGGWLLDLGDGKLERLRFLTSHEFYIEHFNPASDYRLGNANCVGIGRRRIKAE